MTNEIYSRLRGNTFIRFYKSVSIFSQFDELMIQTLIIKAYNDSSFEPGYLYFAKTLIEKTGYGLKDIKEFTNILRDLDIIDLKNNYITDYIYIINSIKDIIYMVDNKMEIKQYSRYLKLNKLKSNILDKQ